MFPSPTASRSAVRASREQCAGGYVMCAVYFYRTSSTSAWMDEPLGSTRSVAGLQCLVGNGDGARKVTYTGALAGGARASAATAAGASGT